MIKKNIETIILATFVLFVILMYFRDNKSNELISVNLEQTQQIKDLNQSNTLLLIEVHEIKAERLQINELEHEVKMFYDSSYIDVNTPDGVKDSILTDFFRQYDMLVGQRLRKNTERTDSITGT